MAARAGAGLLLETPTWRANPDWGARLGYDVDALHRVNRDAVAHLRGLAEAVPDGVERVLVVGAVGPRGDGYLAGDLDADRYADYHRPQLAAFAEAGADLATAYTLTTVAEAVGIVRAGQDVGLPVAVSFTVETDGRLPDGTALGDAIEQLDAAPHPAPRTCSSTAPTPTTSARARRRRPVGRPDRRPPGELLAAQPRRARRGRGARRGRPPRPRGPARVARAIAAGGADRRRVLRHRRAPRRGDVGGWHRSESRRRDVGGCA